MTPIELRALIAASGLGVGRFARLALGRDRRTLQRWLDGEPIPPAACAWLEAATVRRGAGAVMIRVRVPGLLRAAAASVRAHEAEWNGGVVVTDSGLAAVVPLPDALAEVKATLDRLAPDIEQLR